MLKRLRQINKTSLLICIYLLISGISSTVKGASFTDNVIRGKELFDNLVKCANAFDKASQYQNYEEMVLILIEANEIFIESEVLSKKLTRQQKTELNKYVRKKLDKDPSLEEKIAHMKYVYNEVSKQLGN